MASVSCRVDVFIADANTLGIKRDAEDGWLDRLSRDERHELASLRAPKPYLQFLLSRALLRTALLAWGGAAAAAWRVKAEPSGRPYLQADAAAHLPAVSLSHSGTIVICALTESAEVGVDVETDRARDIDTLVGEVLEESELSALNRVAAAARRQTFFQFWTLKEACSKALGTGMATPFRELVFRLDPPQIGFTSGRTRSRGEFISFIPYPDTVAALALLLTGESLEPSVRFYRMTAPDCLQDTRVTVLASTRHIVQAPAPL